MMEKSKKKRSSRYPGVYWITKRKMWGARYQDQGVAHWLGSFDSEDDAYNAYKKATAFREDYKVDDLPGEEWRSLVGSNGRYMVSNMGRVKATNFNRTGREKLLVQTIAKGATQKGYRNFSVVIKGKVTTRNTHIEVWKAFNGRIGSKMEVNHKDFNKGNNCLNNLELVTHKDNIKHYYDSLDQGVGYYYKHHGAKWLLFVVINGEKRSMGLFDTLELAQRAHRNAMGENITFDNKS